MKKRWLCGTMALVIGAMAMAGCSGGNSSSSASAAGTEAADSGSSVDTSGAEMTIRVAHVCGTGSPYDYGANAFKKLVEEGKAYPCFTTEEEYEELQATDKKAEIKSKEWTAADPAAALAVLGYTQQDIAVAMKGVDVENLPLEEIVRQSLKKMVK